MRIKENNNFIFDAEQKIDTKYFVKNVMYYGVSFYYDLTTKLFHPHFSQKKYYCSICAIFRDEAVYLKEWIEYHLIIGVDHFYLYNNFSSDNYLQVLQPYIDAGIVTLKDWKIKQGQMKAYQDCYDNYHDMTNWIAFIDLDEFIVPIKNDNLKDFLKEYIDYPGVLIYWKYFGSSGKIERENPLVTNDFTVCWRKYANIGKMIFNTSYEYINDDKHNSYMHLMWGRYNNHFYPPVNICKKKVLLNVHKVNTKEFPIQINHYVVKSYNEYAQKKSKRGGGVHDVSMHDIEYFRYHESYCGEVDYHIFKYLTRLKLRMLHQNDSSKM